MPQTESETTLAEPIAPESRPWYAGISGQQWLVLIVASAGWVFDIYENQIFAVTKGNMLGDLLRVAPNAPAVQQYGDMINSLFLVGGAVGGVAFGMIADRFGRGRSMVLSILVYAVFSAMTAAAQSVWQVAVLRFLVATGTGGEWAVAAALVSEVFPRRARAQASGIFHASSILGGMAAGVASIIAGPNWRHAFLLGLVPALLVFAVRFCVRDQAHRKPNDADDVETGPAQPQPAGERRRGFAEFWTNPNYRRRAVLGLLLAGIGLIGYWGIYVAGQDLARHFLIRHGVAGPVAEMEAKRAYTFYQNIGNAVGLFSMGPLCAWLGRRRAFVFMQVGALVAAPLACFLPTSYGMLLVMLSVMGFFVNGMHAGYAVWFPELFPAHLRATGAGICFNGARLLAAPALAVSGWLKGHLALPAAVSILAGVYLLGLVVALLLPETKGRILEE
jgi:MFS family permease